MCARRQAGEAAELLLPPGPFAAGDQRGREQRAEEQPDLGPEQAGFDRIAHQEDAAERQRNAADPDHPLGAEALLEADAPAPPVERRLRCPVQARA